MDGPPQTFLHPQQCRKTHIRALWRRIEDIELYGRYSSADQLFCRQRGLSEMYQCRPAQICVFDKVSAIPGSRIPHWRVRDAGTIPDTKIGKDEDCFGAGQV